MNTTIGVLVWVILMLLAIPYVRHAKHPDTNMVAAYLLFVAIFSMVCVAIYTLLLLLLQRYGALHLLTQPLPAVLFLVLVFVPAFLLGRWQVRKPPRRVPIG